MIRSRLQMSTHFVDTMVVSSRLHFAVNLIGEVLMSDTPSSPWERKWHPYLPKIGSGWSGLGGMREESHIDTSHLSPPPVIYSPNDDILRTRSELGTLGT